MEGPQQVIMPYRPCFKVAIFSSRTGCQEINCNSGRSPGATWRFAALENQWNLPGIFIVFNFPYHQFLSFLTSQSKVEKAEGKFEKRVRRDKLFAKEAGNSGWLVHLYWFFSENSLQIFRNIKSTFPPCTAGRRIPQAPGYC